MNILFVVRTLKRFISIAVALFTVIALSGTVRAGNGTFERASLISAFPCVSMLLRLN